MDAIVSDDEDDGDNGDGAADVEEEPNLPVGVAIEGLAKIFEVIFHMLIRPSYYGKMKSFLFNSQDIS